MKKVTKLFAIIAVVILLNACSTDDIIYSSSTITSQQKFIENYNGVDTSASFIVDVEFSDTDEGIIIEANENLHAYIEVKKINGILVIKLRDNISITGNNTVLKAHIITKNNLNTLSASGASNILLHNTLEGDEISLNFSGASILTGTLEVNTINLFASGASNISVQGSSNLLNGELSGASVINGFEMTTNHTDMELSGGSNVSLTVQNTIDLIASGASIFRYKGAASIGNLELSGASQILNME